VYLDFKVIFQIAIDSFVAASLTSLHQQEAAVKKRQEEQRDREINQGQGHKPDQMDDEDKKIFVSSP
jgi:Ni/Co efflux regulator RcnB